MKAVSTGINKIQTSIIYKIFSYLCLFYIVCLPLKAITNNVSIVKYNIPILVIASIVIIMLSKKRLSYELTIKFKNATLWVLLGMSISRILINIWDAINSLLKGKSYD